jgi:hypothetical protein
MESDLTIEKVAEVLANAAPKGLLMVRDELAGWLLGMNRFNAGAGAFWQEAYGGHPYSVDRVKNSDRISVPWLAVAWHGCIQPSRLGKVTKMLMTASWAAFSGSGPRPQRSDGPRSHPMSTSPSLPSSASRRWR